MEDSASGTLIIRIRENLDFGSYLLELCLSQPAHTFMPWRELIVIRSANTAQLKGLFSGFHCDKVDLTNRLTLQND